jgi:hypothetical protein
VEHKFTTLFVAMQKVAILASVAATSLATSGHMSSWVDSLTGLPSSFLVDSSCQFANKQDGGVKSPAATSPHLVSGRYCSIQADIVRPGAGARCGACYNVSARAGWEVVQVVDTTQEAGWGSPEFVCNPDVFTSITGASTGVFPVSYNKIACEVDSAVGVATVFRQWDETNGYLTAARFSDLPYPVSSAKLKIGKKSFPMSDREWGLAGQTFEAHTDRSKGSASFELTLADGSINKLDPCFKSWPVASCEDSHGCQGFNSSCAPAADRGTVGETCAANAAPCLTSSQPKPCCTPYTDSAAGWTIMDTCYEKTPGFNVCRKAGTCKGDGWSCKVIHGLAVSNTTVV